MSNISFTAAGVPLTIAKSADGSLYAYTSSFPNVGIPAGTPGNFASGPLTTTNLDQGITNQRQFISNEQATISAARNQLRILETNPASVLGVNFSQSSLNFALNEQRQIIAASEQRITGATDVIRALSDLRTNVESIKTGFEAANPSTTGQGDPTTVPPPDAVQVQNQDPANTSNGNLQPPINPQDDPGVPPEDTTGEPINGLDLPPEQPPINGLNLPPEPLINGLDLPPTGDDDAFNEFGDLDAAIARQAASEPVLSEDGEVALGIRRNTETGEIFYTDPPTGDDDAFDEFGDLDAAIARQQASEPVLSEDGEVATGIRRNTETGEIFYTDAPTVDEEPIAEADEDQQPDTEDDAPFSEGTSTSIDANKTDAQQSATNQDAINAQARQDWRVRLSLSPGANYLYKANPAGILAPLAETDGVIFPYTPTVAISYNATYDPTHPTHSNYKIFQYNNSGIDSISITGDFTAQDTKEANYLLAVIHFFKSVTKMFYGQDELPKAGTPPPLCYLFGFGAFQFNAHPIAITTFNYSLPNDVDYIKANISYGAPGVNRSASNSRNAVGGLSADRLGSGIQTGGTAPPPAFTTNGSNTPSGSVEPTYVPTRIQIQLSAIPIISRNEISNQFSVKKYATGELLRGTKRPGGGIW